MDFIDKVWVIVWIESLIFVLEGFVLLRMVVFWVGNEVRLMFILFLSLVLQVEFVRIDVFSFMGVLLFWVGCVFLENMVIGLKFGICV